MMVDVKYDADVIKDARVGGVIFLDIWALGVNCLKSNYSKQT